MLKITPIYGYKVLRPELLVELVPPAPEPWRLRVWYWILRQWEFAKIALAVAIAWTCFMYSAAVMFKAFG